MACILLVCISKLVITWHILTRSQALDKDKFTVEHTDGLLDLVEIRDLHGGPLGFYRHIIDLFEKERAYSYAADFAKIAVQFAKLAKSNEASF